MTYPCETPHVGAAALFALALHRQLPMLTTDRLILRSPRVTDFETYAGIVCSERGQHMSGPMTHEEAWADFARMTSVWPLHGHRLWTIGHAGSIAGFVVLGFDPEATEPEFGFMLTAEAEGQGIAEEAARAALAHACETLGWSTLISYIATGNTRALALATRLGASFYTRDLSGTVLVRYRAEANA